MNNANPFAYSEIVKRHFMNPQNMGEIENPDGVWEVGNVKCGDIMRIYIKVNSQTKVIEDIKFLTYGCVSAIASTSMLTGIIKGKTLEEAKKVTYEDVYQLLGGLPKIKVHCSTLSIETLHKAIENYEDWTKD